MKRLLIFLLFFSLLSYSADFNSLLDSAFKNNREIQSAKKQVESSVYMVKSARSLYLPDIEASYFKIVYDKQPLVMFPSITQPGYMISFPITDNNFTQFTVDLNYLIFDFGGRKSAYKTAKRGKQGAIYSLNLSKRNVALSLLNRYVEAIQLKETLNVVNETLDAVNKHLENIRDYRKEGLVPKSDLLRIEALKMNIESQKALIEGNLNTVLKDIERITFKKVDARDLTPLPDINLDEGNIVKNAVENREELKLILVERDVNRLKAKIEKAGLLPQVVAKIEYTDTTNNLNPIKSNTTYYVGVKFKLFDGMKKHYRRKSYLKLAQKNEDLYSDTKKQIEIQIQNELATLNTLEKQLDFYKKAYEASKENYRVVKLQFDEHIVSTVDLKDAISDLKDSEANYLVTKEKVKGQKLKLLWLSKKIQGGNL